MSVSWIAIGISLARIHTQSPPYFQSVKLDPHTSEVTREIVRQTKCKKLWCLGCFLLVHSFHIYRECVCAYIKKANRRRWLNHHSLYNDTNKKKTKRKRYTSRIRSFADLHQIQIHSSSQFNTSTSTGTGGISRGRWRWVEHRKERSVVFDHCFCFSLSLSGWRSRASRRIELCHCCCVSVLLLLCVFDFAFSLSGSALKQEREEGQRRRSLEINSLGSVFLSERVSSIINIIEYRSGMPRFNCVATLYVYVCV